jgi:ubiquitin carboxyl-terminal hydrolase L5
MAESRRNPKRKATDSARKGTAASIDLLEEALRPLEPKEIEEWEGWIELESEPVSLFFARTRQMNRQAD